MTGKPMNDEQTSSATHGVRATDLLTLLADRGIKRLTGVPCSSMIGLINMAQSGSILQYANAPNEGEALAYAAGVWLGGQRAAVLCQNSGLGNLYNCLTSLCIPYKIPTLLLCGWRGMPGISDEPQHKVMGSITEALFSSIDVPHNILKPNSDIHEVISSDHFDERKSLAVLISPNAFESASADTLAVSPMTEGTLDKRPGSPKLNRIEAVRLVSKLAGPGVGVVVSTGLLSREYFAQANDNNLLCMAGSMGHAAALGLGAYAASDVPILVIEGDGSVLMRPQGMIFIASESPSSFCHLVIDNAVHESTGGQPTLSPTIDLAKAAIAFGYKHAVDTVDADVALEAASLGLSGGGPVFVRLRILGGGKTPPRIDMPFSEMASRFRKHLSTTQP